MKWWSTCKAKYFKKVHCKEVGNIRNLQVTKFMVEHKDKINMNYKVHFVIIPDSPAELETEFILTWPKFILLKF
jgi:hypothetical protein